MSTTYVKLKLVIVAKSANGLETIVAVRRYTTVPCSLEALRVIIKEDDSCYGKQVWGFQFQGILREAVWCIQNDEELQSYVESRLYEIEPSNCRESFRCITIRAVYASDSFCQTVGSPTEGGANNGTGVANSFFSFHQWLAFCQLHCCHTPRVGSKLYLLLVAIGVVTCFLGYFVVLKSRPADSCCKNRADNLYVKGNDSLANMELLESRMVLLERENCILYDDLQRRTWGWADSLHWEIHNYSEMVENYIEGEHIIVKGTISGINPIALRLFPNGPKSLDSDSIPCASDRKSLLVIEFPHDIFSVLVEVNIGSLPFPRTLTKPLLEKFNVNFIPSKTSLFGNIVPSILLIQLKVIQINYDSPSRYRHTVVPTPQTQILQYKQ